MYDQETILRLLRTRKPELEKRYPISELAIFGSYARKDFTHNSDIDILVDFYKNIDAFEYIRLAHELKSLFNVRVDVVSRKGIKAAYMPYVEKNLIHV